MLALWREVSTCSLHGKVLLTELPDGSQSGEESQDQVSHQAQSQISVKVLASFGLKPYP
jgi:hypothetical protein